MAAKNICECENPPGGTTECDINQTAYCIVQDGKVRHICVTPKGENNRRQLVSVFAFVTGKKPKRPDVLTYRMLDILRQGRYQDRTEDVIVNFNLPFYLRDFLDGFDGGASGKGRGPEGPIRPAPAPSRRRIATKTKHGKSISNKKVNVKKKLSRKARHLR